MDLYEQEQNYFRNMVKLIKDSGANLAICQWGRPLLCLSVLTRRLRRRGQLAALPERNPRGALGRRARDGGARHRDGREDRASLRGAVAGEARVRRVRSGRAGGHDEGVAAGRGGVQEQQDGDGVNPRWERHDGAGSEAVAVGRDLRDAQPHQGQQNRVWRRLGGAGVRHRDRGVRGDGGRDGAVRVPSVLRCAGRHSGGARGEQRTALDGDRVLPEEVSEGAGKAVAGRGLHGEWEQ